MAKISKRLAAHKAKVDRNKVYSAEDGIALVKEAATAKFDESIDVAINLGIDARKSDQVVRGSVVLPRGTGKSVRVAVFAQGANAEAALAAGAEIVAACRKSPFSRVKTIIADLTAESARARGYIKGNEKLEQVFDILTRSTTPQTIYKKQKLDRDDLIDITEYSVVNFINMEMKMMLIEELGRAIMVGDGRAVNSPDKIKAANIRPIITDDNLYCIKKTVKTVGGVNDVTIVEAVIKAMGEFEGTGRPTMYCHPSMVADLRLLRDDNGRFLFGDIPSADAIATRLGVAGIVETTFFGTDEFLLVNLADYTIGATKGGEVTTFNDFDIDYNQEKYLIETRVSGALTIPKSAIYFTVEAAA